MRRFVAPWTGGGQLDSLLLCSLLLFLSFRGDKPNFRSTDLQVIIFQTLQGPLLQPSGTHRLTDKPNTHTTLQPNPLFRTQHTFKLLEGSNIITQVSGSLCSLPLSIFQVTDLCARVYLALLIMPLFKKQYVENDKAVKMLLAKKNGKITDSEVINRFAGRVHEDAKSHPEKPSSSKLLIEIKTMGLQSTVWAEEGSVDFPLMFKEDTTVQFCLDLDEENGRKVKDLYLEKKGASGHGEDYHCTAVAEAVSFASLLQPYDNTDAVKMLGNAAGSLDFTCNRPRRFAGFVKEEPTDHMHKPPEGPSFPNGELDIIIESPSLKSTVKAKKYCSRPELRHLYGQGKQLQFVLEVGEKDGKTAGAVWFKIDVFPEGNFADSNSNYCHNMKTE